MEGGSRLILPPARFPLGWKAGKRGRAAHLLEVRDIVRVQRCCLLEEQQRLLDVACRLGGCMARGLHGACMHALRRCPHKAAHACIGPSCPTVVPLYERLCEDGELAQAIGLGQHLLDELQAVVELLLHRRGRSHSVATRVSVCRTGRSSQAPVVFPRPSCSRTCRTYRTWI